MPINQYKKQATPKPVPPPPKTLIESLNGFHSLNIFTNNDFRMDYRNNFRTKFLSTLFFILNVSIILTLLLVKVLHCSPNLVNGKLGIERMNNFCLFAVGKRPYTLTHYRRRGHFSAP